MTHNQLLLGSLNRQTNGLRGNLLTDVYNQISYLPTNPGPELGPNLSESGHGEQNRTCACFCQFAQQVNIP